MKNIVYIIAFYTLTLISCNNVSNKPTNNFNKDTIIKKDTNSHYSKTTKTNKPILVSFKMSNCKGDCEATERILSKKWQNDTLRIKVASIQNCSRNKVFDIDVKDNTLNFIIQNKPIFVKNKKGTIDTLQRVAACDCFFYFDFTISNIKEMPSKYLINNRKFRKGPIIALTYTIE